MKSEDEVTKNVLPHSKPKPPDHLLGRSGRDNEAMIRNLMKLKKRRGNPKDYVILVGDRMFDAYGNYPIERITSSGENGMVLLHKKNLHLFIGEENSKRFWNRKFGIRIPNISRGKARRVKAH